MRSVIVLVFSVLMVSCLYTPKEKPVVQEKEAVVVETPLFTLAKYNKGDKVLYIDYEDKVAKASYFNKAACLNVGTVYDMFSAEQYAIVISCTFAADNKDGINIYVSLPERYIVSKINE